MGAEAPQFSFSVVGRGILFKDLSFGFLSSKINVTFFACQLCDLKKLKMMFRPGQAMMECPNTTEDTEKAGAGWIDII